MENLWILVLMAVSLGFVPSVGSAKQKVRVVYPKKTLLDFEGSVIDGRLERPAEFYFEHRVPEKFGSLLDRRKNFHRELLRDAVMAK